MGSKRLIRYGRCSANTISRTVSLKIAHQTLRFLRQSSSRVISFAPVRAATHRGKPLRSIQAVDLRLNLASDRRKAVVFKAVVLKAESTAATTSPARGLLTAVVIKAKNGPAKAGLARSQSAVDAFRTIYYGIRSRQRVPLSESRVLRSSGTGDTRSMTLLPQRGLSTQLGKIAGLRLAVLDRIILPDQQFGEFTWKSGTKPAMRWKSSAQAQRQGRIASFQPRNHPTLKLRRAVEIIGRNKLEQHHSLAPKLTARGTQDIGAWSDQMRNGKPMQAVPLVQNADYDKLSHQNHAADKVHIGRVVSEFLNADARRPPSGVVAFDSRSAPIWPGRKPAF